MSNKPRHRQTLVLAMALALVVVGFGVVTLGNRSASSTPPALAVRQGIGKQDAAEQTPLFADADQRLAYLRWLGASGQKLKDTLPNAAERREFLQTVWFESHRAGLDTALVMGVIETVSNFRKFHVAENGSRGYMGVSPHWTQVLADGDAAKLFHLQTNLRFGCVLLRRYLDARQGDLPQALADYYQNNLGIEGQSPSQSQFVGRVLANQRHW